MILVTYPLSCQFPPRALRSSYSKKNLPAMGLSVMLKSIPAPLPPKAWLEDDVFPIPEQKNCPFSGNMFILRDFFIVFIFQGVIVWILKYMYI